MGDNLANNEFLSNENLLSAKEVVALQIQEYLDSHRIKKMDFAETLHTSRSQLDRLLDPQNSSLNLKTLLSAAEAMGKRLEIRLIEKS